MVEKLSVQIALEGAEEIERQFAGVSKAGQQCFADIQKAAANVGGLKNLDTAAIEASLKKFGITATAEIDKIKAALSSATKLEGRVLGIAELEQNFGKLGKAATAATAAFGLTRRELGGLRTALRQVDLGPLGNQFTAMGRIGSAFGPIGISIGAVGVAVAAATAATIAFAQSITKVSAEAIKLGLSFQAFDDARKRLEGLGISAQAISAGFSQMQQAIESLALERVARDADTVKNGLAGSDAALKRLKQTALEFTAAGNAAAEALRQMDIKIPGLNEKDIQKFGIELTRLITLVEKITGKKVGIDIEVTTDPAKRLEAIEELLRLLPHSAERTAAALQLLGPALGTEVIQKLRLMEGSFTPIEANAIALTSSINKLQAALARLGTLAFAPAITSEIDAVTTAINSLQVLIEKFSWARFTTAIYDAANAMGFLNTRVTESPSAWDLFGTSALGAINPVRGALETLVRLIGIAAQMFTTMRAPGPPLPGGAPIGGPGGGIGSNAAGGLLGGRGTGTSDSNLAWVSRGEHIMPARAVSQPGVLAFLEALRRSGGNLSRVLDGMGRFALGGMVPRAIPAFAAGGLAGGMSNVTIQFPGMPAISGLRASSNVVDQLHKAAALAQVRSGGRKPSRYS